MSDPILRRKEVSGTPYGYKSKMLVTARGGLHFLKGNKAPYFSLTGDVTRIIGRMEDGRPLLAGDCETCGCIHDILTQEWPELAPLVALHLSGVDGAPMHAAGNGLYWLAGAAASPHAPRLPVWGQKYHGASGDYGKTPAECLKIAAGHFRVPESELAPFVSLESRYETGAVMKARVDAFTEAQRERWGREAESAIATYGLVIYGDLAEWERRPGARPGA